MRPDFLEENMGYFLMALLFIMIGCFVWLFLFWFDHDKKIEDEVRKQEKICKKLCGISRFSVNTLDCNYVCLCLTEEGWKEKR